MNPWGKENQAWPKTSTVLREWNNSTTAECCSIRWVPKGCICVEMKGLLSCNPVVRGQSLHLFPLVKFIEDGLGLNMVKLMLWKDHELTIHSQAWNNKKPRPHWTALNKNVADTMGCSWPRMRHIKARAHPFNQLGQVMAGRPGLLYYLLGLSMIYLGESILSYK